MIGCKSGGRSAQAAALLEASGYTQVVDMRGGFGGERDMFGRVTAPGWAEAGLPVEKHPPGASYADLKRRSDGAEAEARGPLDGDAALRAERLTSCLLRRRAARRPWWPTRRRAASRSRRR